MVQEYYDSTPRGREEISRPEIDEEIAVSAPVDLVRWGPIIAGMFAALSATTILAVLGLAIGFSSIDPGDSASAFGIGAGIWGGVTALLAFFFGGWIAARTAAVSGGKSGLLQGSMVWMVAIPLLVYAIAGGLGSIFKTAGSAVSTGVQAAAPAAPAIAGQPPAPGAPQPGPQDAQSKVNQAGQEASQAIKSGAQNLRQQVTPERVERAAKAASKGAWGTLISLLLGLGAASLGGYLGARKEVDSRSDVAHPAYH